MAIAASAHCGLWKNDAEQRTAVAEREAEPDREHSRSPRAEPDSSPQRDSPTSSAPPAPRADGGPAESPSPELLPEFTTAKAYGSFSKEDLGAWKERVPNIRTVEIPSSADGTRQDALFYAPEHAGAPRPLLVLLHSWSAGYLQNINIPYAVFARENGWVAIFPDHRGRNRRPEATGSALVLSDVMDAVEYAKRNAAVDPNRIYVAGYSGGGMTALLMAARRPDVWAGALAWTPVVDLVAWYEHTRARPATARYAREIAASCGGPLTENPDARRECRERSPLTHLDQVPDDLPIYIATGMSDDLVPPRQSVEAFNRLAAPEDRLSDEQLAQIQRQQVPPGLAPEAPREWYQKADTPVLIERTSGNVTLIVFRGGHDALYNPGLLWLSRQRRD